MTSGYNKDEDPDTQGKTVPPYDGRKEAADVAGKEESTKGGVKTGGATSPTESDDAKAPAPEDTERGATGSPADEQPASESTTTDTDPDMVDKPSHTPGTPRAEDQP